MENTQDNYGVVFRYLFTIFFLSRFFALPFAGRIYSICSICVSLYIMIQYVLREVCLFHQTKIKIDMTTFSIIVFILIQLFVTASQKGSLYYVLSHMYPVLATTCFINMSISRHPRELIKAYVLYVFIILIVNFLDMMLFRDISFVGGRIATKSFLIGGITGFGMQYALVLMFLLLYKEMNNGLFSDFLIFISAAIMIITTVIVKTATTYICVLLNMFIIFFPFGLRILGKLRGYIIYAGYMVLWGAIVILRRFNVFQYLITEIFHRDLTLTHRTEIWDTAIRNMTGRWLTGYGAQNTGNVIQIDAGIFSLHNQGFQLLYEGGIILLMAFSMVYLICTSRRYFQHYNLHTERVRAIIMSAIIICLINMLTESPGMYELFFLLLFYFKSEYLVSLNSYKRTNGIYKQKNWNT